MIDWQNIVVGFILVAVVAWLIRAILRAIATRRYSQCGTCDDATCPYRKKDETKKG
ncbi:MAG: FeoB-associated Cys-rich membrane protein [Alistipes sp.]|nr:FeoB-associated Cys-rich membrane protein [Alistipes sp.]